MTKDIDPVGEEATYRNLFRVYDGKSERASEGHEPSNRSMAIVASNRFAQRVHDLKEHEAAMSLRHSGKGSNDPHYKNSKKNK